MSVLIKIIYSVGKIIHYSLCTLWENASHKMLVKKILFSKEITTAPNSNVDVCIVTSHSDYPNALLAVKSLFYYLNFSLSVVVIDDGSLEKKDLKQIQHHLKGAKIITDSLFKTTAARFFNKNSEIFKNINLPYIRKKIAPKLFSTKDRILFLDSDVLFFKKPYEIIQWIKGEYDCFYIQDFQDAYFLSNIESIHLFKKRLWPKVNSGLLGIKRNMLNMRLLEKIIPLRISLSCYRPLQYQVFFALIFSMSSSKTTIVTLPKAYLISDNSQDYKPTKLIAGHYIRLVRRQLISDSEYVLKKIKKS